MWSWLLLEISPKLSYDSLWIILSLYAFAYFAFYFLSVFLFVVHFGNTATNMHGDLKYSVDFTHFKYVNFHEFKAYVFKQVRIESFYSLNSFIVKRSCSLWYSPYLRLTVTEIEDEPLSLCVLVAEKVRVEEGFSAFRFLSNLKHAFKMVKRSR